MALLEVFDADAERAVTKALITKAKQGRVAAARLLFEYKYGKPRQALDLGDGSGKPISIAVLLERAQAADE